MYCAVQFPKFKMNIDKRFHMTLDRQSLIKGLNEWSDNKGNSIQYQLKKLEQIERLHLELDTLKFYYNLDTSSKELGVLPLTREDCLKRINEIFVYLSKINQRIEEAKSSKKKK